MLAITTDVQDHPLVHQGHQEASTLRDGRPILLRPIRPDDEPELREGFARLSRRSRYLRFHGTLNELPGEAWHALTHADGVDQCAVVALDASPDGARRGLGVARYVRVPGQPDRAEIAITVADEAQGLGLGEQLLRLLARRADARGIDMFVAYVLFENRNARSLFERLGATAAPGVHAQLSYELPIAHLTALQTERSQLSAPAPVPAPHARTAAAGCGYGRPSDTRSAGAARA
jgi:GNAT superfamily N-acetyltransferase